MCTQMTSKTIAILNKTGGMNVDPSRDAGETTTKAPTPIRDAPERQDLDYLRRLEFWLGFLGGDDVRFGKYLLDDWMTLYIHIASRSLHTPSFVLCFSCGESMVSVVSPLVIEPRNLPTIQLSRIVNHQPLHLNLEQVPIHWRGSFSTWCLISPGDQLAQQLWSPCRSCHVCA